MDFQSLREAADPHARKFDLEHTGSRRRGKFLKRHADLKKNGRALRGRVD